MRALRQMACHNTTRKAHVLPTLANKCGLILSESENDGYFLLYENLASSLGANFCFHLYAIGLFLMGNLSQRI